MTDLTNLDYAFILCFKQANRDNATLLRNLMKAQSEWSGSPVEYIGLDNVAYMINRTVSRMGLLNSEHKMHLWYDGLRMEALSNQISGYNPMNTIIDELEISEHRRPLAEFYIRHILMFGDAIRWTAVTDIPGLAEYRAKVLDKPVNDDSLHSKGE